LATHLYPLKQEAAIATKDADPTPGHPANGLTYKDAGVDIDAGNALVDAIKPMTKSTARPGADGALGGFGGLFDLRAAGFSDPVLVAATDGVGTKLKIAIDAEQHNGVGIDLVAMCVNDLIVQGAEPLFFLDYFATGELSVDVGASVVSGIAEGCRQAGCALIGGETAEMPGMYGAGDYDLAGFAVGAAERGALLDGSTVQEGDILLGLASSGVHSNGFSLVRKVVEISGRAWSDEAPFEQGRTLGEALLTPTRIYVRACLDAIRTGAVRGLVHITGGGFYENLPRILPDGLGCTLNVESWPSLPVFDWLQKSGGISSIEMHRTFNCGIGMVLVVDPAQVQTVSEVLARHGEQAFAIGSVTAPTDGQDRVQILGIDS